MKSMRHILEWLLWGRQREAWHTMMAFMSCLALAVQAPGEEISDHLQKISVTIGASGGSGSGVTFCRDGATYVWTAAHVVDSLRSTREVVDARTGTKRIVVEFADAKVLKMLVEDGRTVGRVEFDAEVIRYSDFDSGHDQALLRVRKKDFPTDTVKFYLDLKIPPIGTNLLHVGSLLGQMGANSMTTGIMSQHGRLIGKTIYDQTTCTAFPGSSGGGVFLQDGRYVGMLVRGAGEGFNLIVPARRLIDWAKNAGVYWAVDHNEKMPTPDELAKIPVEDSGVSFATDPRAAAAAKGLKEFPFLLRRDQDDDERSPTLAPDPLSILLRVR